LVAAAFTPVLYRHWKRSPGARYLFWWMAGVAMYGAGTLTEALTTLFGWNEPVFRAWYITGALLGGVMLAQGTVYLLVPRARADLLSVAIVTYVAIATVFVLSTPIDMASVEPHRLSGKVMEWSWVRLFSPLLNLYALIFLVGGAAWSAWRYWRRADRPKARVVGNALIAVGALLPGIGGTFARLGHVEVLYVGELVGLVLIWAGYRQIAGDSGSRSIHKIQQTLTERPLAERTQP
jgi:hypothetical protein